nr:MAG TPA: hypothetical protein [Crassvirales sp.]DAH00136.1 MAG TPA: hypothetical protein [Crassvirales sp.]
MKIHRVIINNMVRSDTIKVSLLYSISLYEL